MVSGHFHVVTVLLWPKEFRVPAGWENIWSAELVWNRRE